MSSTLKDTITITIICNCCTVITCFFFQARANKTGHTLIFTIEKQTRIKTLAYLFVCMGPIKQLALFSSFQYEEFKFLYKHINLQWGTCTK